MFEIVFFCLLSYIYIYVYVYVYIFDCKYLDIFCSSSFQVFSVCWLNTGRSSGAASKNFSPEHVPMTVELAANNLNQCGHHISVHGAAGVQAASFQKSYAYAHGFFSL